MQTTILLKVWSGKYRIWLVALFKPIHIRTRHADTGGPPFLSKICWFNMEWSANVVMEGIKGFVSVDFKYIVLDAMMDFFEPT